MVTRKVDPRRDWFYKTRVEKEKESLPKKINLLDPNKIEVDHDLLERVREDLCNGDDVIDWKTVSDIYDLISMEDMSVGEAAERVGYNKEEFKCLIKLIPGLSDVINRAVIRREEVRVLRKAMAVAEINNKNKDISQLDDLILGRLPPELRSIWKKLVNKEPLTKEMEMMLASKGEIHRMRLLAYALIKCDFNATKACKLAGVPYRKFMVWSTTNLDFIRLMEEVRECKKDLAEESLIKLVKKGDRNAVIFVNKTLNKDRGYGQTVEVNSQVTHNYNMINIEELDLPVEIKIAILNAIRNKKEKEMHVNAVNVQEQKQSQLIPYTVGENSDIISSANTE